MIEKIRGLKYSSVQEFNIDLNSMRNNIEAKMARYIQSLLPKGPESNSEAITVATLETDGQGMELDILPRTDGSVFEREKLSVLRAFDTIVDASYHFLSGKELAVSLLEDSIRSQLAETAAAEASSFEVCPHGRS